MRDYQKEKGAPPSMEEIQTRHKTLNYRSSALFVLRSLVAEGRVKLINGPKSARRHMAVLPEPESPGLYMPGLIVQVIPTETIP